MLILQESCTDQTASFVIYAPIDIVAMNAVLIGSDRDYVALLPSGFAILSDGGGMGDSGSGGSLLTVSFQILTTTNIQKDNAEYTTVGFKTVVVVSSTTVIM
ncbi:putative homeobox protein [Prunus yedoensis var. nudiflora]|uniref:Putative homeobox protein n=1 Tax=Prunus yedoensis var. nudiflora TaxID=2094558 RepID=A0A314ZGE4_PRUYE|nr:putative homeobox protein [Prunus yedoensis var. nudiflora]